MEFICENKECENYLKKDKYTSNVYSIVDGEYQSNNAPCPKCGKIRREINPNADISLSEKNIGIAAYSSSSKEIQQEILKKRSHEHYEKKIKPQKEFRLNEAMKNFKETGKN